MNMNTYMFSLNLLDSTCSLHHLHMAYLQISNEFMQLNAIDICAIALYWCCRCTKGSLRSQESESDVFQLHCLTEAQ